MTLRDLLDRAAGGDPSRPYLFFRDEVVTIGNLVQRVDALAAALWELRVRRGDHVAVLMANRPEFLYIWFALASLGAVMVPLNPTLTARELREILRHSDATGLIAGGLRVDVLADALGGTAVRWIATADRAVADGGDGTVRDGAVPDDTVPKAAAGPEAIASGCTAPGVAVRDGTVVRDGAVRDSATPRASHGAAPHGGTPRGRTPRSGTPRAGTEPGAAPADTLPESGPLDGAPRDGATPGAVHRSSQPAGAGQAGAEPPTSVPSPAGAIPEHYALAELLAGPARQPARGPRGDEAIASLVYTSGTTGAPRGVLKTHRSYTRVAAEVTRWLEASPADRFFTCFPLFHTHAQVYAVLPSLACGGSLVLAERFSASRFWDALAASNATVFTYLGTMLAILARTPPTPAERRHRVRAAIGGGATAELERTCVRRFGVPLVELYALTETSTVTVRPLDAVGSPGSAGWPTAYCDVRILDDAGRACPPGVVGEIAVSPSEVLMAGYYKDPAAAAAAFHDGWFLTGDLGWRDARGALYVAGRKKELIRHRGEHISPAEVEAVLASHPAVAEVAVVGRPSELGDEDVCAVVVPAAGAEASAEALQAFCLARLAPFKVPTIVEFRPGLPKTATQKVRRELLRQAGAAPWNPGALLRESGAALREATPADLEVPRLDPPCSHPDGLGTATVEANHSTANDPDGSETAPVAGSAPLPPSDVPDPNVPGDDTASDTGCDTVFDAGHDAAYDAGRDTASDAAAGGARRTGPDPEDGRA